MTFHNITMIFAKRNVLIGFFLILLLGAGTFVYFNIRENKEAMAAPLPSTAKVSNETTTVVQNLEKPLATVKIDEQYPVNLSDDRILVGASHNIFVAKVLQEDGSRQRFVAPETQFEVEIISNIKGNLSGTVTVDQAGGYENGKLYYVEDGMPLLQPGKTYLFSARYDAQDDWYLLTSYLSAWKLISQDSNLTTVQLNALAQDDSRVNQLKAAYPREMLLSADVKNKNTRNSYQSVVAQERTVAASSTVASSSTFDFSNVTSSTATTTSSNN